MARAPFPEARGRAASWPAPFCVSTCFAEAYLPRGLVLFPADDSPSTREGERTRFLSLSFPLSVPQPADRASFSLSLPAYSVFARTRAFVPARGSFVNFIVSCTRDRRAAPWPRVYIFYDATALYF